MCRKRGYVNIKRGSTWNMQERKILFHCKRFTIIKHGQNVIPLQGLDEMWLAHIEMNIILRAMFTSIIKVYGGWIFTTEKVFHACMRAAYFYIYKTYIR